MSPKKTTSGSSTATKHNGHVSLAREEYDALIAREESYVELVATNAKNANRVYDLTRTCAAQAARLAESELTIAHLRQVSKLQEVFIDMLRADAPAVASLVDLSDFWRRYSVAANRVVDADKSQRGEVVKLEPDLFRSWRLWVRDYDKHGQGRDRTFAVAGTRAEVEAHNAIPQATLQDHILDQQRAQNAALTARNRELEGQIEAYRNAGKAKP